jgi:O-antigen ligase
MLRSENRNMPVVIQRTNGRPAFLLVNALLLIYVVRITILTMGSEVPGLNRYVVLQLSAVIGMFLIVLMQERVPLRPVLHDTPITMGMCLYGLGVVSAVWSVMPAMSFAFAFQMFAFVWILYYLMGYHDDFRTAEKYLIGWLTVLMLFGLFRRSIVYGHSPTVSYFLNDFHELTSGGIGAALFSYCLAERTACQAGFAPGRARMLTLVAIFAFGVVLVSTSSGSNVSLLMGLCALALVRRNRPLLLLLVAGVLMLVVFPEIADDAIAILFPGKTERRIWNVGSRTMLWADIWQLFRQKPIWGWGFATVERLGSVYASDSHNAFMGILGGLGLIGAGIFIAFILYTIWRMYKLRHLTGYSGLLCATVCMVANSNTYGFLSGKTYILTIAFFALISCAYWYRYRLASIRERDRIRMTRAWIAAATRRPSLAVNPAGAGVRMEI